ncbi:alpha-tocopherol transfer protein-like [Amblyomma americanum]
MNHEKSEAILALHDLPERFKNLALHELEETGEKRRQALKQLRQLILDEPLHFPSDETFLLAFLRARKYDVLRAFKNVMTYCKARRDNPDMFDDLSLHRVPFDTTCRKHRLLTVSRKTDPEGRPAIMLKFGAWNTDICSLNDYYRVGILHAMHVVLKEEFQVKGTVIVLDIKGLRPYHLAHYTPFMVKKFLLLVQDCCPMRIKRVYIINNPAIFDVLFAIGRPFMKHKLVKRVRLLGYDVNKLHNLVPDDLIPEEYGGTHESFDYGYVERELKSRDELFQRWNSYSYLKATKNAG